MDMLVYLGKGLREPVAPFRTVTVYGADLNTPNADGWNYPPQIVDPVVILDLSQLTPNREAVVALCNLANVTQATDIVFRWRRLRDNALLYTFTLHVPDPAASGFAYWAWYYAYSYQAYVSWELSENGGYSVEITAGGQLRTIAFTVTGISTEPPPPSTAWPWPLDAVQGWFEDFYNMVLGYFTGIAQAVYDALRPAIDEIWYWVRDVQDHLGLVISGWFGSVFAWIDEARNSITETIFSVFSSVWTWIWEGSDRVMGYVAGLFTSLSNRLSGEIYAVQATILQFFSNLTSAVSGLYNFIGTKVLEVNTWFSNEFIDPFIDWLVPFPGNLVKAFGDWITGVFRALTGALVQPGSTAVQFMTAAAGFLWAPVTGLTASLGPAIMSALRWIGDQLLNLSAPIGEWFSEVFSRIGGWFVSDHSARSNLLFDINNWAGAQIRAGLSNIVGFNIPPMTDFSAFFGVLSDHFVAPAIDSLFTWAEAQGQVNPTSGRNASAALSKVVTFTLGGLSAMTIAGELLWPLKQLGLGNVAAMLYDFINYKTLTAAFMGVLAVVYVQKPLTYYYNRIARPNIPNEQHLALMLEQRAITSPEFRENMTWQGYPDSWIERIEGTLYRPMTPYMLRSLAEAGLLDDALLEHSLNQAGYDDISKPAIKRMMANLAANALTAVSSSTAMTRYQEGFDDETALRKNLSTLGVADSMLDRYVFAAGLKYLYDYQSDLKAYYVDLYHRREIEEPELRSSLVMAGLSPERLDLVVDQQKIKRLAATKAAEDPALAVQLDTIRDRRKKNLITREQEIAQLVALGRELAYATALADNDEVAMTPAGQVVIPVPVPAYETEAGKVQVDTIRRLRRSAAISPEDELQALIALEMPVILARAIVENDELRIRRSAGSESGV